MFYPYSIPSGTAQLPRILSEDVGAPELRNPMLYTKSPFQLHLPQRQPQHKEQCCPCTRPCTAGVTG